MDVVWREHIVGHVSLVDVDVFPLPALGFVTGHGVSVLNLQRVVVLVQLHPFQPIGWSRNARLPDSKLRL